jgi:hypothetical protein
MAVATVLMRGRTLLWLLFWLGVVGFGLWAGLR